MGLELKGGNRAHFKKGIHYKGHVHHLKMLRFHPLENKSL